MQFAADVLGVTLWSKQQEVLNALANHRRVAVKSGNGLGKDFTAAVAALWFLHCHDPAIVLTTAPTFRQVRNILWRQIQRLHDPAADTLGGKMLNTRWELSQDRYALGLSAGGADRFQGFHCENVLVIVDEAAGVSEEIYEAVDAVMTSSNAKLLLIGNPTTTGGAFHRAFHQERGLYETITISALDSPNVTGDEPPVPGLVTAQWVEERRIAWGEDSDTYRSRVLGQFPARGDDTLISMDDIEAAIYDNTYDDAPTHESRHSAGYRHSRFRGNPETPATRQHSSLEHPWIPAQGRNDGRGGWNPESTTKANVPIASALAGPCDSTHDGGFSMCWQDSKTPSPARGEGRGEGASPPHTHRPPILSPSQDPGDPFGMFLPNARGFGETNTGRVVIGVDVARFGNDHTVALVRRGNTVASIRSFPRIDTMAAAGQVIVAVREHRPDAVNVDAIGIGAGLADRLREQGVPARAVNVAEKPRRDRTCLNLRAEGYQSLARRFRDRRIRIPRDARLIAELATLRYEYDSQGRLRMESKASMKKRGVGSPDKADALMLAFLDDRSNTFFDEFFMDGGE